MPGKLASLSSADASPTLTYNPKYYACFKCCIIFSVLSIKKN